AGAKLVSWSVSNPSMRASAGRPGGQHAGRHRVVTARDVLPAATLRFRVAPQPRRAARSRSKHINVLTAICHERTLSPPFSSSSGPAIEAWFDDSGVFLRILFHGGLLDRQEPVA